MVNWTEQYRPETLDGVRGNEAVIDELRGWAKTWDEHREALLLHGPPGIGKTTAAHALAREMGWITVELSGSEHRTATDIERYVGRGGGEKPHSGKENVVLPDST